MYGGGGVPSPEQLGTYCYTFPPSYRVKPQPLIGGHKCGWSVDSRTNKTNAGSIHHHLDIRPSKGIAADDDFWVQVPHTNTALEGNLVPGGRLGAWKSDRNFLYKLLTGTLLIVVLVVVVWWVTRTGERGILLLSGVPAARKRRKERRFLQLFFFNF